MASGKIMKQLWLLPSLLFPGVYSRSFLPLKKKTHFWSNRSGFKVWE